MYEQLQAFLTPMELRPCPIADYELPTTEGAVRGQRKALKVLKTYIAVGARICAVPAWDHELGTIDFLTPLDLAQLSLAARSRSLPDAERLGEPVCAC